MPLAEKEDDGGDGEDNGGDEEGNPVTVITSDEGSGDGRGGTQVDSGIEVHVYPLVGQCGADDDRFSGFHDPLREVTGVLLGHQGGDIGFDGTGADAHDEDGDDQAAERSVGVLESRRSSSTSEDHVASPGGRDQD